MSEMKQRMLRGRLYLADDAEPRRDGWEYGLLITLGDNVWLGGGVIVYPGVTIGGNTVVGAGAVVTRDLPAEVVASGGGSTGVR